MSVTDRMRAHVEARGGPAKDEDGNIVVPNGAWMMMLEASDTIDALAKALTNLMAAFGHAADEGCDCRKCAAHFDALAALALTQGNSKDGER